MRRLRQNKDRAVIGIAADTKTARTITLDDLPIFCDERRYVQAYDFPRTAVSPASADWAAERLGRM